LHLGEDILVWDRRTVKGGVQEDNKRTLIDVRRCRYLLEPLSHIRKVLRDSPRAYLMLELRVLCNAFVQCDAVGNFTHSQTREAAYNGDKLEQAMGAAHHTAVSIFSSMLLQ